MLQAIMGGVIEAFWPVVINRKKYSMYVPPELPDESLLQNCSYRLVVYRMGRTQGYHDQLSLTWHPAAELRMKSRRHGTVKKLPKMGKPGQIALAGREVGSQVQLLPREAKNPSHTLNQFARVYFNLASKDGKDFAFFVEPREPQFRNRSTLGAGVLSGHTYSWPN
ncbi:hypothetical protein [Streptomyces chengmaiensis]|nr:hypothetical protein [Streptomyces chengmaiensis]